MYKIAQQEAIDRLKKWIKPGDTIYTIVTGVARSGMSRTIRFFKISDGEILSLDYNVARALGWRIKDRGVHVEGCGMDMGFHAVETLSRILFNDGQALKQRWL